MRVNMNVNLNLNENLKEKQMKETILVLSCLLVLLSPTVAATNAGTPLNVVNQRMNCYNQHNLTCFLNTYAEEVKIYNYPDQPLAGSKSHLKAIFEPMFIEGKIRVTIHHQIVKGSYVINQETVDYSGEKTEYLSIYKVVDGLITEVRFVRE
jgi:hypothetical protein